MFFQDRINIRSGDKVLDIGPGSDPHPLANVLLEITASEEELKAQRGHTPPLKTDKEIVYYEGNVFPFKNKQFDYVICAHVFEHVDDLELFWSEVQRVARRGYIEFPTIYYDYLYNFDVHVNFLKFDEIENKLFWMKKSDSDLSTFSPIHKLFYESLCKGYDDIIRDLKEFMFQGFEWDGDRPFQLTKQSDLKEFCLDETKLTRKVPSAQSETPATTEMPPDPKQNFLNRLRKMVG